MVLPLIFLAATLWGIVGLIQILFTAITSPIYRAINWLTPSDLGLTLATHFLLMETVEDRNLHLNFSKSV